MKKPNGPSRLTLWFLIIGLNVFSAANTENAETELVINAYGGTTWGAIGKYIHEPYTEDTGVKVTNTTQPNLAELHHLGYFRPDPDAGFHMPQRSPSRVSGTRSANFHRRV